MGKVILKAERAAQHRNWSRAIVYGEQSLAASRTLDDQNEERYINLLRNLNYYYDKAGRLAENAARVKAAYELSRRHLGLSHPTSLTSRNLYYKLLVARKDYHRAIPLVHENITVSRGNEQDDFRLLHYQEQLGLLYSLTGQLEKEEDTLLQLLTMNIKILGAHPPDNKQIILMLARNYCLRKRLHEFRELMTEHGLKYYCKW